MYTLIICIILGLIIGIIFFIFNKYSIKQQIHLLVVFSLMFILFGIALSGLIICVIPNNKTKEEIKTWDLIPYNQIDSNIYYMNNGKSYVVGIIGKSGIEYIELTNSITTVKYSQVAKVEVHYLVKIPDKLDNFRIIRKPINNIVTKFILYIPNSNIK